MTSIFFNETGFRIEGSLGEVVQVYDAPAGVQQDATALYDFRWYVFNSAMEQLAQLGDIPFGEEVILYTDSRLVEELNGEIKTDSRFADASRSHYIKHDLPRYRRIRIEKCAPGAVRHKLNECKSEPRH